MNMQVCDRSHIFSWKDHHRSCHDTGSHGLGRTLWPATGRQS
jgi:hypothetical protein